MSRKQYLYKRFTAIIGDKRVTAIINDRSASHENIEEGGINNQMLMYLQIPIAVAVFGFIFLLWKCISKKSSASALPAYYEEEMKLNDKAHL